MKRRSEISSWRRRLGLGLEAAGRLALPLGAGAVLGFWIADRGTPWLPDMLAGVLVATLAGLVAIGAGMWLRGRAVEEAAEGRRLRRRMVVLLLLVALGVALRLAVFWAASPSPLTGLSEADYEEALALDLERYRDADRELAGIVARFEATPGLALGRDRVLAPEEERALRELWGAARDVALGLDQVRRFHEDYYRFDPSRHGRSRLVRSFLLTFAAELALVDRSTHLVAAVDRNPSAAKFLDAPHPGLDLPAGTLSRFRERLQGTTDQARVLAGERYLAWLENELGARTEIERARLAWLRAAIDRHLAALAAIAPVERTAMTIAGDLQPLERALRGTWLPTQKGVAEWMGDTRTRRIGRYLIEPEQLVEPAKSLEPGDVLLSRKNWYLSNLALPGFWPHAILYFGTPAELESYFDDPEIEAWLAEQPGAPQRLVDLLAAERPDAWSLLRSLSRDDSAPAVLEAVSEGVVFNSLEDAAGDYLVGLHPRRSRLARAQALLEAFRHVGKPYDFDFDFATDHALVCTELVWRAWRPAPGKEGLDLELVEVAGRRTLPAHRLAELFAAERGRPDVRFDFLFFLDASERERRAFPADEAAFAATARRAKWDLLQR